MLLEARSLSKKFEDHMVFSDLSFDLEMGEIYQVKGLNGSGKSTLLKILAGLIRPTTGDIKKKPDLKIGYSSLALNLYPDLTVQQTLDWCAEIKGVEKPECFLAPTQMVGTLSSGQTSYLKLLIALLNDPELLILDEISATLDPINKSQFLKTLVGHQERCATVFASHEGLEELQVYQEIVLD